VSPHPDLVRHDFSAGLRDAYIRVTVAKGGQIWMVTGFRTDEDLSDFMNSLYEKGFALTMEYMEPM
jgi:hypothetical protein